MIYSKRYYLLLCLFTLFILVSSIQECHKKECETSLGRDVNVTKQPIQQCKFSSMSLPEPQAIGAGVLFMIGGTYLSFMGFMFLRPTVFIFGCYVGSFVAWSLLELFEPTEGYVNCHNLYLSVCLGAGVSVGALFMILYQPVIYLMGLSTGVLLYTFFCSWRDDFIIQNLSQRLVMMAALMALFFLLVLSCEFITVIFCLSFLGGYVFMLGLDMMVQKGFYQGFVLLWDFNQEHNRKSQYHLNLISRFVPEDYHVKWEIYVFLASIIGWTLVTGCWQAYYNRGNRFGLRIIRNSNDTLAKIK